MSSSTAAVVYVHGLWMPGVESALLLRRLSARGLRPYVFSYRSVFEPVTDIAAALRQMLARIDAPQVHLLGHSLGGVVIQRFLERYRMSQSGRAVFLGSPCAGSQVARRLARWSFGRRLLGRAAVDELLVQRGRRWESDRELGIIAGTMPLGFGRLLLTFREANDGTVAVSETAVPGAKYRLCLPVTHTGLLLSARVARETGNFFEHGRFGP